VQIDYLKKMEAKVTGRHALAYACHGKLWVVCEGICRRLQHKTIRLFNSFLEQVMEIEEEYYDGSKEKTSPIQKFASEQRWVSRNRPSNLARKNSTWFSSTTREAIVLRLALFCNAHVGHVGERTIRESSNKSKIIHPWQEVNP
jgi:hypothetical protein